MPAKKRYDAFLSHNNLNKPDVEQIANWLKTEGKLKVWLDKWNIVPGDAWQEEIEKALDDSRACVVFLGTSGLGGWQHEEMRAAIADRVQHNEIRVVPVLLPSTSRPREESDLPKFLRRHSWVKFNKNIHEQDNLNLLLQGIKGKPAKRVIAKELDTPEICPFRGLEIFREEDAPFFFGRESEIQQLLDFLQSHRFLAVVGPSGSGKSSLVHAGLVPALKQADAAFLKAIFIPKDRPLEELALALRSLQKQPQPTEELITRFKTDEKTCTTLPAKSV